MSLVENNVEFENEGRDQILIRRKQVQLFNLLEQIGANAATVRFNNIVHWEGEYICIDTNNEFLISTALERFD